MNSHSMVDSKVRAPRGAHGGQIKAGPCSGATMGTKWKPIASIERETFQGIDEAGTAPGLKLNVVNKPQPECVEWVTCQSWDKSTLPKQDVNDQSEQVDSGILATEGVDAQAAESWEAECESNQDLALSRFWEMEQGQVTDVQGKLRTHLSFWEDILQPAPWIISCIKEGYKLPLQTIPLPSIPY